jgi:hypothetical protein
LPPLSFFDRGFVVKFPLKCSTISLQGNQAMSEQTVTQTAEPPAPWETRTQEELQSLIRAGFSAGEQYDLAVREIERRGREETRRAEQAAADEIEHRVEGVSRVALTAAIISLLAAVGAILLTLRIL